MSARGYIIGEPGCAVRCAADASELGSYHKLQRELAFHHRKQDVFARKEAVRRWKVIHKSARARTARRHRR